MNREFLQLAHTFDPNKHTIGGYFISTKLDGIRCYWDGGITSRMKCSEIPFANTDKHARLLEEPMSTGLWTRYGQPIRAPQWFLERLPNIPLDGELYAGRGKFQETSSTIKKFYPIDSEWHNIRYMVFDSPSYGCVFQDGKINNTNFKKIFKGIHDWVRSLPKYNDIKAIAWDTPFISTNYIIEKVLCNNNTIRCHSQTRLPLAQDKAIEAINDTLNKETLLGGEGVMLRRPEGIYQPWRHNEILKVKRWEDAEGTVIGYITGRRTDKGSKLLGMLGALILDYKGIRFELSGFTDEERELEGENAKEWAESNPETICPLHIRAKHFPLNSQITFRFRELTNDGVPKEARYWRKSNGPL